MSQQKLSARAPAGVERPARRAPGTMECGAQGGRRISGAVWRGDRRRVPGDADDGARGSGVSTTVPRPLPLLRATGAQRQ